MRKSIVEGDDFSVLPPYALRLGRRLRSIAGRVLPRDDPGSTEKSEVKDSGIAQFAESERPIPQA